MLERYSIIGIAFSLVLITLDFYLLRKRKISGKGFVLWLAIGVVTSLLFMVPPLYSLVFLIFGTEFSISALVAAGFAFFLFLTFYLYYKISELHSLLMKLAIEVSLIRHSQKQTEQDTTNPKSRNNSK